MKVAVLTGGSSTERELSLASAKNVCAALEEAGHRTVLLDASSDLISACASSVPTCASTPCTASSARTEPSRACSNSWACPSSVRRPAYAGALGTNPPSAPRWRPTAPSPARTPTASWPQGVYIAREAFDSMGIASAFDLVEDRVIGGYPVAVKLRTALRLRACAALIPSTSWAKPCPMRCRSTTPSSSSSGSTALR